MAQFYYVIKWVSSRRVSPLDEFWYGSMGTCANFSLDAIAMFAFGSGFIVTQDTPTCVAKCRQSGASTARTALTSI